MTAAAFADPVFQSQATFRAILRAMSRPGEIVATRAGLTPPAPLDCAAAAALLTLADYETPLWLAPWAQGEVGAWLKFHSGAPACASPNDAAFALLKSDALDVASFGQGTAPYPDRSTTLVVEVARLEPDGDLKLSGPGVKGELRFGFAPRPGDFLAQWRANGAGFPLGVDLILTCGERLAALPRTTMISEAG